MSMAVRLPQRSGNYIKFHITILYDADVSPELGTGARHSVDNGKNGHLSTC